jgi:hypothetical protein
LGSKAVKELNGDKNQRYAHATIAILPNDQHYAVQKLAVNLSMCVCLNVRYFLNWLVFKAVHQSVIMENGSVKNNCFVSSESCKNYIGLDFNISFLMTQNTNGVNHFPKRNHNLLFWL